MAPTTCHLCGSCIQNCTAPCPGNKNSCTFTRLGFANRARINRQVYMSSSQALQKRRLGGGQPSGWAGRLSNSPPTRGRTRRPTRGHTADGKTEPNEMWAQLFLSCRYFATQNGL